MAATGESAGWLDMQAVPKIEVMGDAEYLRRSLSGADVLSFQLHAHLSGSISRQCLHEVWAWKNGADQRVSGAVLRDPLLEMPVEKVDYDIET